MLLGIFRRKSIVDVAELSNQNLRDIPVGLYDHKRYLQRLCLSRNQLRDFPKGTLKFEGLTELDLSENDLLFLPPTIGQLQQLKVLNLSFNNLPNIPDAVQNCEELISINISNNPLGRICDGITQLRQLRHLKVNDCELDTLPRNIGKLSKLETLELRDNRLIDLPDSFGELQNLEKLDLGLNELESLPPHIGYLAALKEFWIDGNILLSLPDEIGMLLNLVFFELSENRLIDLPVSFGDLYNLADLYLNDNLLSELPASFGTLHNLQTCKLSTNRLVELPNTLSGLHNLYDLDVSQNFMTGLPDSLCSITTLESLNVNENNLEELPKEIGSCSSLSVLSTRNNKIVTLPKSITQLRNLKVLTAVGNRLVRLPFGLLGIKTLRAVWLAENQIRSMLEFQTQEDSESGEKWITCVLFPQKEQRSVCDETQTSSGSDLTVIEDDCLVKQTVSAVSVNFHSETKESKSSISRDLTPFPKELHKRVKQWRKSRDLVETDETDNDVITETVQLRHSSPKKLSRPYSLLKALNNPVQDSYGFIHSTPSNGEGTLSPDLLLSLPLSEIMEKTNNITNNGIDSNNTTTSNWLNDDIRSITPPSICNDSTDNKMSPSISSNSNSNNNCTSETPHSECTNTTQYRKPNSIISDTSSIVSTKLSNYMKEGHESGNESGQDIPAWYMSSAPSPLHPPEVMSSTCIVEKMETDENEYMDDISEPHEATSPPAFISPIYDSPNPRTIIGPVRMMSSGNDDVFLSNNNGQVDMDMQCDRHLSHQSHYQSPLSFNCSIDNSHYDYVKTKKHDPIFQQPSEIRKRRREKDFAIEYTLQTQLTPQMVSNSENVYDFPRQYKGSTSGRYTPDMQRVSTSGRYTPDMQRASGRYTPDMQRVSTSGRYTPDMQRVSFGRETPESQLQRSGYKSTSSLCDSGIESIRRPTPIGACLTRSASTGIGLDSPTFGSFPRTYEITLRKNPTLGMAITGGRDGENAIYPNDKGYYVYRLVDGMPASSCGKICIGDKIIEVNGINVSNLRNTQVVKLLTTSEAYATILFSRQSSMTLL